MIRGRPHSWRGQSLVEFAIVMPLLAVILLMAIDVGRVYLGWVTLSNVARIGANFAAQNPDAWTGTGDATVQARYRRLMLNDAAGLNCTLPGTLPDPVFADSARTVGSRVTVQLSCSFPLMTPLIRDIIGDGAGNLQVQTSAAFGVRFGSFDTTTVFNPGSWATPTPVPTPTPSSSPSPTPLPSGATPDPSATAAPPVISLYGIAAGTDSTGGGPPGSVGEDQIVGVPNLDVTFYNTTTGPQGNCTWTFGDGGSTNSCAGTVSHVYSIRGTYDVTLNVDGYSLTRSQYVLVACKVPSFSGVRVGNAANMWLSAGFQPGNVTELPGPGNYKIGYQSLTGGLVNPPGGCSAQIQVGP
jgi:Flp pilus assembly protein TadG